MNRDPAGGNDTVLFISVRPPVPVGTLFGVSRRTRLSSCSAPYRRGRRAIAGGRRALLF